MFNPFTLVRSLFGVDSYVGVDIGTTAIKIVEVKGDYETRPAVVNYGILETYGHLRRVNDVIQTSSMKVMGKETGELVKMLVRQMKCRSRTVIASLPAFAAFTTLLEFPEMPDAEVTKAIAFQIPQYIPLPPNEVHIDWLKVGMRDDDQGFTRQQILLTSVPNEYVERYTRIFAHAGLRLSALEVESVSMARAFTAHDPTPTLIVDIGSHSTNILIAQNGFLKQSAQSDFGSVTLTRAIAQGMGIDMKRAEEVKKQRGILLQGAEAELSTLALPFLDVIIKETQKLRVNYEKNFGAKIERILLAGGGANTLGIDVYFEREMGVPTAVGNAFSSVSYPPAIEPFVNELRGSFGVAVGSGIRDLV